MKCPKCNYENLDSAKFCFSCGTPMEEAQLTKYSLQLRNKMINCARSTIFIVALILFSVVSIVQIVNDFESDALYSFDSLEEAFDEIGLDFDLDDISRDLRRVSISFINMYDLTQTVNTAESIFKLLVVFSLWAIFFASFTPNGNLKLAGVGLNIIKIGQIVTCVISCVAAALNFIAVAVVLEGIERIYLAGNVFAIKETVLFWVFIAVTITIIINVVFTCAVCKSVRAGIFVATTEYDSDASGALSVLCYIGGAFMIVTSLFNILNVLSGVVMIMFGMVNAKFGNTHITNW